MNILRMRHKIIISVAKFVFQRALLIYANYLEYII